MNDFHIFQINMHFTLLCNLKCKLCTSYSPYYKKPYHPSFERCCEVIDRFFEVFTTCGSYLILGGEPLIRKDLPQILDYLRQYLPQITKVVRINTNGNILVFDDLIVASQKYGDKINYVIEDYGPELSNFAVENMKRLTDAGINCEIRDYYVNPYCGGWVDFSDMSTRKHTSEDAQELFNKCLCAPWREDRSMGCYDGEIYICGQTRHCMLQGAIPKDKTEYVDIFDNSLTVEQIRARIVSLQNLKFQSACQFCSGICVDSVRFPAAEQIGENDVITKI